MVSGLYDSGRQETNWETGEKRALLAEQAVRMHREFAQSAYLAEQIYEQHGRTGPKITAVALALLRR